MLSNCHSQDTISREYSAHQIVGVRTHGTGKHGVYRIAMTFVEAECGASDFIGAYSREGQHTAGDFAGALSKKADLGHASKLQRAAHIRLGHGPVVALVPLSRKEVEAIHFRRVLVSQIGVERCKSAVNALKAGPAVRMQFGHAVDAAAAHRMPGEIGMRRAFDQSGNLRLRLPDKWIFDGHLIFQQDGQETSQIADQPRMRGPGRLRADDLPGNR